MVFALLYFLLPPLLLGIAFAFVKCDLSNESRCWLAFWSSVLFHAAITALPFAVQGKWEEGLVMAILGVLQMFWLFSLPAALVCWAAIRLRKLVAYLTSGRS